MATKYIVYYRVSTKKQGESGLGLEAQQTYINHFISQEQVVKSFTEVESAKSLLNRPKLKEAVQLCKQKGYTLAIAKIDRLSRTTEDALSIYSTLKGRLFSCDIPNLDKFTLTLFMAIADRERELISIRTKAALDAKKARTGEWRISQLTNEDRKKAHKANAAKAAINENNTRAMGYICSLRDNEGMTYAAIAQKMNKEGFKSSTGKEFKAMTVSRLYKRYCN